MDAFLNPAFGGETAGTYRTIKSNAWKAGMVVGVEVSGLVTLLASQEDPQSAFQALQGVCVHGPADIMHDGVSIALGTVLELALAKLVPEPGDYVFIRYEGEGSGKTGQSPPKLFSVRLFRAAESDKVVAFMEALGGRTNGNKPTA